MPTVNAIGRAYIRAFLVEEAKDPNCCKDRAFVDSLAAACESMLEAEHYAYVALPAFRTKSGRTVWCELPSWAFSYREPA